MDNSDLLFRKAEEAEYSTYLGNHRTSKAQNATVNSHQWDENLPALENIAKIFNRETDMSFVIKKI